MTVAISKRTGKRHLIHEDGLATRCGWTLRRDKFEKVEDDEVDCKRCLGTNSGNFPRERAS